MNENPTHPYTLDVVELPDGRFQWSIRERGKLFQRSDKPQPSEQAAREQGLKAIDGLRAPKWDERRR